MRRVCAWCKTDLASTDSDTHDPDEPITHGVCAPCSVRILSQMGMGTPLQKFLDELGAPILVTVSDVRAFTANKRAREILGKDLDQIEGEKGGDVIECIYSKLPGGCGNTVHCKGCTIRNAATETLATGRSAVRVPAYQDIDTPDGVRPMRFLVSTEKVGEFVLLRIDDVAPGDRAVASES